MPTKFAAVLTFANGTVARLDTSRIAETRNRGMRAVYADGVVEIDFLTRKITNTTPRPLERAGNGRSAGRVGGLLRGRRARRRPRRWCRRNRPPRPLETALLIDEAAEAALPASAPAPLVAARLPRPDRPFSFSSHDML